MDIRGTLDGFGEFIRTRAPWLSSSESQDAQTQAISRYRGIDTLMARLKAMRNRRCLLSLDGGGIRGFSQLLILEELANCIMHNLGLQESPPLCDYFDIIGGVGTGGYLAILAGRLGLTVPQLKEEFKQLIACILMGRVSSDELDTFLKIMVKRWTGDPETLLFDPGSSTSHCKTFVGAVTTGNVSYLTLFRSYETRDPSLKVPIWQAARATLSHPDLFQTRIGSSGFEQSYVSGEMGWSNPSNECIREFEALWSSQDIACLANIGSGHGGVIQIDDSSLSNPVSNAMERMATDCEKVAQEVAYRFQGRNIYFRLSVEQGLQQSMSHQTLTLPDIETHTRSYLKSPEAKNRLEQLVAALLHVVEMSTWTTTRDRFESTIDELVSEYSALLDDIPVATVQLAAQEVILLLETIRHVKSSEDHWTVFVKMIIHQATDMHGRMKELREPLSSNPLWMRIKGYFAELKMIKENMKQLLKLNPHRVWGPPTQQTFLAKATANLDDCYKRVPDAVLNDMRDYMVSTKQDTRFKEFISWISQLDMEKRHQDILAKHTPGTGGWLVNTSEFKVWIDNQNSEECRVLFGFGDPGAGKTFTCCSTIEYLRSILGSRRAALAFIYCDYRDKDNQDICSMISELTKQLLLQVEFVPDEVWPLFQQHTAVTTKTAQQIFSLLLHCFDSICICIDALDECQPKHRKDLLRFFTTLSRTPLRLFCTGRYSIEAEVTELLGPLGQTNVEIWAHEVDIRVYVELEISQDLHKRAMDPQLQEQIMAQLAPHKLFILAAFQLEYILQHITKRARREALRSLPAELSELYEATFRRIEQRTTSQMAIEVLTWTYLAGRKLQVDELQHALATRPGDTAFDEDGTPSEDDLLDCCLGLVVIERETSTIRLTHFTLQEYLDNHWRELFPSGHSVIASTCLTYLNFPDSFLRAMEYGCSPHLLYYATGYLGRHLHEDTNPELDYRAFYLITSKTKLQFMVEILSDPAGESDLISSPLHWAAYFDVVSVAKLLLEQSDDDHINTQNMNGQTAVSLAAENGHETMVQLLLGVGGVEVDSRDNDGRSPLSYAAQYGREKVVKLLLGVEGVEADSRDIYGRTSLSIAAEEGHEEVVRLLLGVEGVEADSRDGDGRSPLSYAAEEGHEVVVMLLLGVQGVKADSRDDDGRTPISYAAQWGREGVVKLLFGVEGVEAGSRDNVGRIPLSYAAEMCQGGVLKLLLDSNPGQIESQDCSKRTPLSWASQHQQPYYGNPYTANHIVTLMLDQYDANPDSRDITDRAPLSYAAEYGRDDVVQVLLERNVDVNHKDAAGNTAFSYAVRAGRSVPGWNRPAHKHYENAMKLLLDHGAVDTRNSVDSPESSDSEFEWSGLNHNFRVLHGQEIVKSLSKRM